MANGLTDRIDAEKWANMAKNLPLNEAQAARVDQALNAYNWVDNKLEAANARFNSVEAPIDAGLIEMPLDWKQI